MIFSPGLIIAVYYSCNFYGKELVNFSCSISTLKKISTVQRVLNVHCIHMQKSQLNLIFQLKLHLQRYRINYNYNNIFFNTFSFCFLAEDMQHLFRSEDFKSEFIFYISFINIFEDVCSSN